MDKKDVRLRSVMEEMIAELPRMDLTLEWKYHLDNLWHKAENDNCPVCKRVCDWER